MVIWVLVPWLKIWKQKLVQMGASIEERLSKTVSHVFASSSDALRQKVDGERLARFKGVSPAFC